MNCHEWQLFVCVTFTSRCVCGSQLVGLAAKQYMMKNPSSCVSSVKRFMGCTATDVTLDNSDCSKVDEYVADVVGYLSTISVCYKQFKVCVLNRYCICFAGNNRWWFTSVQCNVQTEAKTVQPSWHCYHSLQKNDGLVVQHCAVWLNVIFCQHRTSTDWLLFCFCFLHLCHFLCWRSL